MANNTQADPSMPVKVTVAWLFVGIPLAWGLYHTLLNAMKLFQ